MGERAAAEVGVYLEEKDLEIGDQVCFSRLYSLFQVVKVFPPPCRALPLPGFLYASYFPSASRTSQ